MGSDSIGLYTEVDMFARHSLTLALLSIPLMAGCLGIFEGDFEGSDAFECEDQTDNDHDGLTDCEDEDCMESPICACDWEDFDYFYMAFNVSLCDLYGRCDYFTNYWNYDDCIDQSFDCVDFDCDAAEACYAEWSQVSCDGLLSSGNGPSCEYICSND